MMSFDTLTIIIKLYLVLCVFAALAWLVSIYKGATARRFAAEQLSISFVDLVKMDAYSRKIRVEKIIRDRIWNIRTSRGIISETQLRQNEIELLSAWVLRERYEIPSMEVLETLQKLKFQLKTILLEKPTEVQLDPQLSINVDLLTQRLQGRSMFTRKLIVDFYRYKRVELEKVLLQQQREIA